MPKKKDTFIDLFVGCGGLSEMFNGIMIIKNQRQWIEKNNFNYTKTL